MSEKRAAAAPARGEHAAPTRSESRRAAKKKKRAALLWALWSILVLLALLVAAVGYFSVHYHSRFLPDTWLDGVDVSGMTVPEAAGELELSAKGVAVTLREAGADVLSLPLTSFLGDGDLERTAQDAFDAQKNATSFLSWMIPTVRTLTQPVTVTARESDLAALVETAVYTVGRIGPEDAHIDLGETGYTLVPEVEGNLVDPAACAQALLGALSGTDSLSPRELRVEAQGVRVLPAVRAGDELLQHRMDVMDKYLSRNITLDFGEDMVYTLTKEDIWSASSMQWTATSVICTAEPDLVRGLVDRLAEELKVDGVYAKFRNCVPTRELIYYRVGDNGWKLDRSRLAAEITSALNNNRDADLTAEYDRTWYWSNYYGIGNTYLEISLDNQYMWYFIDGEVVVETPFVSGNLSTGNPTGRGYFTVAYLSSDLYLSGPTWNDHVDYWIPFDLAREIGLHDSSWRDEYGGDIYINDGSHGCINTPLAAMRKIYENIWEGVPVIVY